MWRRIPLTEWVLKDDVPKNIIDGVVGVDNNQKNNKEMDRTHLKK